MTTREQNVVTYLNEWRDGSWYLQAPQGIPNRVADEVVAYAGLKDSTANLKAYSDTVARMIANASLKVTYHDEKFITVEVP
jgi:hypothetical protein